MHACAAAIVAAIRNERSIVEIARRSKVNVDGGVAQALRFAAECNVPYRRMMQ